MKEIIFDSINIEGIGRRELERVLEVPKNTSLGDYALPCFSFSKVLKKNPNDIAKQISDKLKSNKHFEKVEAVGPYVNFFLNRTEFVESVLEKVLKQKKKYGSEKYGSGRTMIEFSQPNTHKAFHVGHIRGTSLGESIARIIEFCGDKVIRANYSGDTGMHIAKWLWAYGKFHDGETIKKDEKWFADIYTEAVKKLEQNEAGEKEVYEINKKLDSRDPKIMRLWMKTRKESINSWTKIYRELDVNFDVHFFESEEEKRARTICLELIEKGIAKRSEGAVIVDFKEHGFEKLGVIVLLRSDGTVLYGAKDLALAEKKFNKFKIDKSIYVVGKAQDMHIHQIFKILELIGSSVDKCKYVPVNEVRLPWGKMSSRTGDNVLYSGLRQELIDASKKEILERESNNLKDIEKRALAISISAMKYPMLKQDVNKGIIFNPNEEIKFEGNTGPYLLYSYARARSIIEKVKTSKNKLIKVSDSQKKIVAEIGKFPEVVRQAYFNLSPNNIANYAYELAKAFNEFYQSERVIGSEDENFKVKIVKSFMQTIENCLYLLGIPILKKM